MVVGTALRFFMCFISIGCLRGPEALAYEGGSVLNLVYIRSRLGIKWECLPMGGDTSCDQFAWHLYLQRG